MRAFAWLAAIAAAVAFGLWALGPVPPIDPDGDGLILNGYVLAKIAPWPVEVLRVAAFLGVIALLTKWNWTRFMTRVQ